MSNEVHDTRKWQIFFAGAGLDGEARYEVSGTEAQRTDLTREQLHDLLKDEGVAEKTVAQHREEIDQLPSKTATADGRPVVNIQA